MSNAFIRLIEVTKRYGERRVVDRISLNVAKGEAMMLLGASGCGKTTTLRLIAGLETPDEGEIWIAGECVARDGRNIVPTNARNIGFVFQDLALWPHLTVKKNLEFVLESIKLPKSERAKRISDLLWLVKIEHFANSFPGKLSGGEQQRAALARALVGQPQLLLLDEPMSNLDPNLKMDLQKELATLQKSLSITTIHVTHDQSEAEALADFIAIMYEGRVEQIGTLELLRTNPANEIVARFMRIGANGVQ
jgi:ABC-type Fe3+/spermidine/putrescine transport system ATPase subunit